MFEGVIGFDFDFVDLEFIFLWVEIVYGFVVMWQINLMLDDVCFNIWESLGYELQVVDYFEQWVFKVQEVVYCDFMVVFFYVQVVCSFVSKEQVELWREEVNKNLDFIFDVLNFVVEVEVVSY